MTETAVPALGPSAVQTSPWGLPPEEDGALCKYIVPTWCDAAEMLTQADGLVGKLMSVALRSGLLCALEKGEGRAARLPSPRPLRRAAGRDPLQMVVFITLKTGRNHEMRYIFEEICTQLGLFFLSDFFSFWCNLSAGEYLAVAFPYLSCLSSLGLLMLL